MRRIYLLTLVLTVACGCQNNGAQGNSLVTSEPRVINPEIAKRIEAKRNVQSDTGFPDLSEIPTELPEKYDGAIVTQFENQLLALGTLLTTEVKEDMQLATRYRTRTVTLLQDGTLVTLSLKEAARLVQQQVDADQQKARRLRSGAMPVLGGAAPKDQR